MAANDKPTSITSVLHEERVFKPGKDFARKAHISSLAQYQKLYNESVKSPDKFWGKRAKEELIWFKPWKKVLEWKEPFAKWFVGGQLNVTHNCLDRHLGTPTANKAALIWEGEPAAPGKPGETSANRLQERPGRIFCHATWPSWNDTFCPAALLPSEPT